MKTISFKITASASDIIYYLSGIKAVCERLEAKAALYLWLDRITDYMPNHPVKDISGKKNVYLNHYMFKMLKPLLESQDYIALVDTWNGEPTEIDLDAIREHKISLSNGDRRRLPSYIYTDMACDISEPALDLPLTKISIPGFDGKPYIVVNRTERYFNKGISYFFLKEYKDAVNVVFVGTPKENNVFQKEVPTALYVQPDDFYQLACIVRESLFTIGNNSMVYAIAEQLKTPRILEVSISKQNITPSGENGYDFYVQSALEYYVKMLVG